MMKPSLRNDDKKDLVYHIPAIHPTFLCKIIYMFSIMAYLKWCNLLLCFNDNDNTWNVKKIIRNVETIRAHYFAFKRKQKKMVYNQIVHFFAK